MTICAPLHPTRDVALQAARPYLVRLYGDWLRAGRKCVAAYLDDYRSGNGGGDPTHAQVADAVPILYGSQVVAAYHLRCLNGQKGDTPWTPS